METENDNFRPGLDNKDFWIPGIRGFEQENS
jgi:hypothetical protein